MQRSASGIASRRAAGISLPVADALAVSALLEPLLCGRDVLRLVLQDRKPRLVELLLERLGALVGGVLVVVGQLGVALLGVLGAQRLPLLLDLLRALPQAGRDLLLVDVCHEVSVLVRSVGCAAVGVAVVSDTTAYLP